MDELNWLAIAVAALSTMVVGSLWYGPLFGKAWEKLAKIKRDPNFGRTDMAILYTGTFLMSGITAIVLAIAAYTAFQAYGGNFLHVSLLTGLVLWLGFTAARMHMHNSFEQRRKKLTLLGITYELIAIEIMALIIGVWPA